jgi:hypothetical protein
MCKGPLTDFEEKFQLELVHSLCGIEIFFMDIYTEHMRPLDLQTGCAIGIGNQLGATKTSKAYMKKKL